MCDGGGIGWCGVVVWVMFVSVLSEVVMLVDVMW